MAELLQKVVVSEDSEQADAEIEKYILLFI